MLLDDWYATEVHHELHKSRPLSVKGPELALIIWMYWLHCWRYWKGQRCQRLLGQLYLGLVSQRSPRLKAFLSRSDSAGA